MFLRTLRIARFRREEFRRTSCTFHWVVSRDSPQRKSIPRKNGKLGSNYTVKFSHDASRKITGKEGSIAGNHPKVRTSEAKSMGSKIRGKNARRNPQKQERCTRRDAWNLAKVSLNSKGSQRYVLLSCLSVGGNAGTLFEKARRATIRNRLRSFYACVK